MSNTDLNQLAKRIGSSVRLSMMMSPWEYFSELARLQYEHMLWLERRLDERLKADGDKR